jgi:AcrR family transcriptional regulator
MTESERRANAFVSNAKAQWKELVCVARGAKPQDRKTTARALAEAAGVGKSTLERKLLALHLAMQEGMTDDELIERGQRWVLAKYVNDKRNGRQDKQAVLKWLVNPETRDDVQELFARLGRVLKRHTSEELFDFLLAVFADVSDEEILHLAGEGQRAQERSNAQR